MITANQHSKLSTNSSNEGEGETPAIPSFDFEHKKSLASLVADHRINDIARSSSHLNGVTESNFWGKGDRSQSSKMVASADQGTPLSPTKATAPVPFHLPWTRSLTASSMEAQINAPSTDTMTTLSAQRNKQAKAPPSSFKDFRVSPSYSKSKVSPAEQWKRIEQGRRQSLKRSRAPTELNVVVAGARNSGKTSWIRALISTCDLSKSEPEAREEALLFGVTPNESHPTRFTDPATPMRTNTYEVLEGLDLQPESLIPIPVLAGHVNGVEHAWGQAPLDAHSIRDQDEKDRATTLPSRSSVFGGSNKVQLSITDTPGIDFEVEDEFEVERKVTELLRYVEDRLFKTLSEETKVRRMSRGDGHIHLVVYFIDPRFVIENVEARRKERERERYASLQASAEKRAIGKSIRKAQGSPTSRRKGNADPVRGARGSQSTTNLRHASEFGSQAHEASQHSIDTSVELGAAEVLPASQISILSRLSRRANVLPVIAKADTLTASELDTVQSAVQRSIAQAGIDLGTFGLNLEDEVKPMSARNGRRNRGYGASTQIAPEEVEELEEVKVIKIRPRKAYSIVGVKQLEMQDEKSSLSKAEIGRMTHSRQNSAVTATEGEIIAATPPIPSTPLSQTAPLYEARHGEYGEDFALDEDSIPYKVPLCLFVPEPVPLDRAMQPMTPLMTPDRDYIPPVPSIPREPARSASSMTHAYPDRFVKSGYGHTRAVSEVGCFSDDGTIEEMADGGPGNNRARYNAARPQDRVAYSPTPTPRMRFGYGQRGAYGPPMQSRRYVRDFRFGQANILDPSQSDFALLRLCLLGSNIQGLRENTVALYEQFRSERLERRRAALLEMETKSQDAGKGAGAESRKDGPPSSSAHSITDTAKDKKALDAVAAMPPLLPQSSLVSDELF